MTVPKGRSKKSAPEAPENPAVELVQPLKREALQIVLSIIDRADIKGSDAQVIVETKRELLRVAGIKPNAQ